MMKLSDASVFVNVHYVLIQQDALVVGLVLMTTYLRAYRQQAQTPHDTYAWGHDVLAHCLRSSFGSLGPSMVS